MGLGVGTCVQPFSSPHRTRHAGITRQAAHTLHRHPATASVPQLVSALLYHIVPGSQTPEQLLAEGILATELTANVTLTVSCGAHSPAVGQQAGL